MEAKGRILALILIMAGVAAIVGSVSIGVLYHTAFEQKRADLRVMVEDQVRLMAAISRRPREVTDALAQIVTAHNSHQDPNRSGELVLAWRDGNMMAFVSALRDQAAVPTQSVAFRSQRAAPMRRALAGESGTMIGIDYRGVRVLAAYQPVPAAELGLVAKVDLAEVRQPFLRAGATAAALAILFVALGTLLFLRIGNPVVIRLREDQERYRLLTEQAGDILIVHDLEGRLVEVNQEACRALGYGRQELLACSVHEIEMADIPVEERCRFWHSLVPGNPVTVEGIQRRKDGTTFNVELRIGALDHGGERLILALARDVTERKQAEEVLRERERLYRDLYEEAPYAYFSVDAEGAVTVANRRAEELLGRGIEDLLGRAMVGFFADQPAGQARAKALYRRFAGGMAIRDEELEMIRSDGSMISVSLNVQPILDDAGKVDASRWAIADVTDRVWALRQLTESEARYRTLVEQSPEAIFVHRNLVVLFANSQAAALLGADSPATLIGRSYIDLIEAGDHDRVMARIDQVMRTGAPAKVAELRCLGLDGNIIDVESTGSAITMDGQPAIQTVLRDVSERKQLREQLQQSQKLEAVGRLTGGVAHDFNNLLTVIMTNLAFLQSDIEAAAPGNPGNHDEHQEMIAAALEATQRGADVTHRLLAFSRQQSLLPEAVDLSALVKDTVKLLQPLLGENIEIEVDGSAPTSQPFVDRGHLQNALVNLAVNARDAMPQGGRLKIEFGDVERAREGRWVLLAVSDSGGGIPAEIIDKVFDPFFTTKGSANSSGLGLSMVQGFVSQSGGQLELESEAGVGTALRLYLPLAEKQVQVPLNNLTASPLPEGGERILLVEDDHAVRNSLARGLRRLGYSVAEAENGPQALELLDDSEIDLLITDVVMPRGLSGFDLAREVRHRGGNFNVIYMSGNAEIASEEELELPRSDLLLSKPFSQKRLAETVRIALDN